VHLADSLPKSVIERVGQMIEAMPDGERLRGESDYMTGSMRGMARVI
jgi:hypothetical protein